MISINIHKKLQGSSAKINLDINLKIEKGSFVAISGQSGSGKTTFLRILAGLEEADGNIEVENNIWMDSKKHLAVQQRDISFVFQDYALFPNMTVVQNLLFVVKNQELAQHLLKLTGLSKLRKRFPHTLSGGQQQRVALCRAFMRKPKLLLMDEPLSALDPEMRSKLQNDILTLHKEFKTTTIMVSHDPSEIYKLSNRVIVLQNGQVLKDGDPKNILLQTSGSQKFYLRGEIIDIIKADIIFVAIVSIGQQIVEIVLDEKEASSFKIGQSVNVSTKAFAPSLSSI